MSYFSHNSAQLRVSTVSTHSDSNHIPDKTGKHSVTVNNVSYTCGSTHTTERSHIQVGCLYEDYYPAPVMSVLINTRSSSVSTISARQARPSCLYNGASTPVTVALHRGLNHVLCQINNRSCCMTVDSVGELAVFTLSLYVHVNCAPSQNVVNRLVF